MVENISVNSKLNEEFERITNSERSVTPGIPVTPVIPVTAETSVTPETHGTADTHVTPETHVTSETHVTPVTSIVTNIRSDQPDSDTDLQRVSQVTQSVTKPGYTLTPSVTSNVTPIVTNKKKRKSKETREVFPKKIKEDTIQLVTNELRPYACTKCDLKFKTLDKLVKHAADHERPNGAEKIGNNYKCDTCGFKFSSQVTYNGHECPSHPIIAAQCPDCEYVFPSRYDLIVHLDLTGDQ